jgi:hypothetical protein
MPEEPEPAPVIQRVQSLEQQGPKAYAKAGCVTALKRELERLTGEPWSNQDILAKSGRPEAARQLERFEAGKTRVDPTLVAAIARTFGLDPRELVYDHEIFRKRWPGKTNPIAELIEEREALRRSAHRDFAIDLVRLSGVAAFRKLADDIVAPGIEKRLRHPWRDVEGAAPCKEWQGVAQRLKALLGARRVPRSELTVELRTAVSALEQHGLRVTVARHIFVGRRPEDPSAPPGDPVRRVTVVVAASPGEAKLRVNLLPSLRRGATRRKQRLHTGDLSVILEIRADIRWCGTWEGRWVPVAPGLPDWLRAAAEKHTQERTARRKGHARKA